MSYTTYVHLPYSTFMLPILIEHLCHAYLYAMLHIVTTTGRGVYLGGGGAGVFWSLLFHVEPHSKGTVVFKMFFVIRVLYRVILFSVQVHI